MQYWQHVERFPVHRETLPRDAETQFRNALAYGFKGIQNHSPHTSISASKEL
jgi:hypothetical protein